MSRTVLIATVAALGFGMQAPKAPAWASDAKITPTAVGNAPNASVFGSRVFFAGQPGQADFEQYAKLGVKKVINLRTPAEMQKIGFDEGAAVKQAGMEYVTVPIGAQAPTDDDLAKIYSVLQTAGDAKVLMHCASSNRVGLAWSLFRGTQHGLAADDALAEGKAAGLKAPALEKIAREKLAQ
jgi:uncharacterized protein (TIGR01244 family)